MTRNDHSMDAVAYMTYKDHEVLEVLKLFNEYRELRDNFDEAMKIVRLVASIRVINGTGTTPIMDQAVIECAKALVSRTTPNKEECR